MKTKLFFTFCLLAGTILVMHAQDIITRVNGDEIKAKVTEVNINEVKYKKFEAVSGPTYTIAKSDIFMIKYENGEKEMFKKSSDEAGASGQKTPQNTSSSESESIRQSLQSSRQALQNSSQGAQSAPQQTATTPQSVQKSGIQFGMKGGLNVASESTDNGQTDSRAGIYIGFFGEAFISKKVGFQPELMYSMQGGSSKVGNTTVTDKLDYINLPLIFKFYVWQQRFSIDAGPQFGYMISSNYDNITFNKFDVSIDVGVSYKLSDQFDLTFRVNVGMIKLLDGYSNTNNVGQLGIGYKF